MNLRSIFVVALLLQPTVLIDSSESLANDHPSVLKSFKMKFKKIIPLTRQCDQLGCLSKSQFYLVHTKILNKRPDHSQSYCQVSIAADPELKQLPKNFGIPVKLKKFDLVQDDSKNVSHIEWYGHAKTVINEQTLHYTLHSSCTPGYDHLKTGMSINDVRAHLGSKKARKPN